MELLLGIVLIVIAVGILAAAVVFAGQFEKKRTATLAELAREMALDFAPKADASQYGSVADFKLFQSGSKQLATNLISGRTQSVGLKLFDYSYVTGSGKNQTTHKHTVVAFDSPLLDLPAFELGPKNLFHQLASKFGYQDIDFAGYPTFNRKYLLRGPDEAAIRHLFTEDVIQFFEAQLERRKKIESIAGAGSRLLVTVKPRVKPAEVRALLEHAFAVYGHLKTVDEGDDVEPSLADAEERTIRQITESDSGAQLS